MVGVRDPHPEDVQATFCATLVDEWLALGVRHAVVAPGSRSTPMALALTDRPEMRVHVVHDERSAAFVALGLALDGDPALLLCTSGTASANFYPAVVEAGLSEVPMIVLTADRPEELRNVGAPQTIDQIDLYGRHVVWSRDPGVPVDAERSLWRELALDAWSHAARGPVQLNLAFREPLLGVAGDLPPRSSTPTRAVATNPGGARRHDPVPTLDVDRGLIVVGGRSGVSAAQVSALAERTGWPVVADPVSQMRGLAGALSTADALLRNERFAAEHLPDVIVRIGRPAASKVLAQWTARATEAGAVLLQVGGPGLIDPEHNVAAVVSITDLLDAASSVTASQRDVTWLESWVSADRLAGQVIVDVLAGFAELTEPGVARTVAESVPDDADLVVASSMPVRDLEWFGGTRARAHANRGANGIDGVLGTALGRALTGRTTFVLLGDLAFVHDSNALTALERRDADLRIVVVDNDGGGIFSFLPQATALPADRFELLFGTPLGVDIVALATSYGLEARTVQAVDELVHLLDQPGPWVCCVPTDRRHNVEVHAAIHTAVSNTLDAR
ncbi:MAG TPA: 2-succinyl-5-enolpyruvyl-6-hydroxy-3-cyclohexene-1-carboxylic-acid synthase [Ilumatobacteraceae bacterium]|nr:2-succinyl-5-enolpyruvyl-6-hydroxy-3-cyclohexene-1-carboxylic-acid synthase [Ilumatobacteraceae bacterium]